MTTSSLLHLPPELRVEVLEHVICSRTLHLRHKSVNVPDLAVLAICQQLRNEALPVLAEYILRGPDVEAIVNDFDFLALGDLLQQCTCGATGKQTKLASLQITVILGDVKTSSCSNPEGRALEANILLKAIKSQPLLKDGQLSWRFSISQQRGDRESLHLSRLWLKCQYNEDITWADRMALTTPL